MKRKILLLCSLSFLLGVLTGCFVLKDSTFILEMNEHKGDMNCLPEKVRVDF